MMECHGRPDTFTYRIADSPSIQAGDDCEPPPECGDALIPETDSTRGRQSATTLPAVRALGRVAQAVETWLRDQVRAGLLREILS
jgi:hypothetical protein